MVCEAHLVSCRHIVAQFVSPPPIGFGRVGRKIWKVEEKVF